MNQRQKRDQVGEKREREGEEVRKEGGDGLKDRQEGGEMLSYFFWMYFIGLFSETGMNAQFVCTAQWEAITPGNIRASKAVGSIEPVR